MGLTLTDGVLGGILLLSMVVGAWRGLVHELMSLVGWVAAFFVAQWLAQDVALWLPLWREAAPQVRYAVSFVLVFVASMFAAALVSWLQGHLQLVVDRLDVFVLLGRRYAGRSHAFAQHLEQRRQAPDRLGALL